MMNVVALKEARSKFLQLGQEIEHLEGMARADALHTHSKLGIFLEQALGKQWRGEETKAQSLSIVETVRRLRGHGK